jgi:hypothetical protein
MGAKKTITVVSVFVLLWPLVSMQRYSLAADPRAAAITMRALDRDRFIDRRWLRLLQTQPPFDESEVAQAMVMRWFNVRVLVNNPNSGKTACRIFGESAVEALSQMARIGVPYEGYTFSRKDDGHAAAAYYANACYLAFANLTLNTGGADGWPIASDWKLAFKQGLAWAYQLPRHFPRTRQW